MGVKSKCVSKDMFNQTAQKDKSKKTANKESKRRAEHASKSITGRPGVCALSAVAQSLFNLSREYPDLLKLIEGNWTFGKLDSPAPLVALLSTQEFDAASEKIKNEKADAVQLTSLLQQINAFSNRPEGVKLSNAQFRFALEATYGTDNSPQSIPQNSILLVTEKASSQSHFVYVDCVERDQIMVIDPLQGGKRVNVVDGYALCGWAKLSFPLLRIKAAVD